MEWTMHQVPQRAATDVLRSVELGYTYDDRTNEVKTLNVFNLDKAADLFKIVSTNVTDHSSFSDDSEAKDTSDLKEFGAGIKGTGWGIKVAAAYNYSNRSASAQNETRITATVLRAETGYIELRNLSGTPAAFFESLKETDLKRDYDAIRKEKNRQLKAARIMQFKQRWGTGIVSKVYLMRGVQGKLHFEVKSKDNHDLSSHEGEVSVGNRFVAADGKFKIENTEGKFTLNLSSQLDIQSFPYEDPEFRKFVDEQLAEVKAYINKKEPPPKVARPKDDCKKKLVSIADLTFEPDKKPEPKREEDKKTQESLDEIHDALADLSVKTLADCFKCLLQAEEEHTFTAGTKNFKQLNQLKSELRQKVLALDFSSKRQLTSPEHRSLERFWSRMRFVEYSLANAEAETDRTPAPKPDPAADGVAANKPAPKMQVLFPEAEFRLISEKIKAIKPQQ